MGKINPIWELKTIKNYYYSEEKRIIRNQEKKPIVSFIAIIQIK